MRRTIVMNFPIHLGKYSDYVRSICAMALAGSGGYTCVANVHMVVEAFRFPTFREIMRKASLVTPDGMPLTWMLYLSRGIRQDRVAGMDLLPDLLLNAERLGIKVYFYGSTPGDMLRTVVFLEKTYPELIVAGAESPPFRALSPEEQLLTADRINDSGAQLIFVILGCPKQEIWMHAMRDKISGAMVGVGGALSVLLGDKNRAPHWMQRSGLEWVFRFAQDPRRLFKRYVTTNTIFTMLALRELLGLSRRGVH